MATVRKLLERLLATLRSILTSVLIAPTHSFFSYDMLEYMRYCILLNHYQMVAQNTLRRCKRKQILHNFRTLNITTGPNVNKCLEEIKLTSSRATHSKQQSHAIGYLVSYIQHFL